MAAAHSAQSVPTGLVGAAAHPVGGRLEVDRCAELVLQPVHRHLELHRPDGGEHRRLLTQVGVDSVGLLVAASTVVALGLGVVGLRFCLGR